MYTPNQIIDSIRKLEMLEELANACDSEWEQNPESEEAEQAFDDAYRAEFQQAEICAMMIHEYSMKAIDLKTARRMISHQYRGKFLESIGA